MKAIDGALEFFFYLRGETPIYEEESHPGALPLGNTCKSSYPLSHSVPSTNKLTLPIQKSIPGELSITQTAIPTPQHLPSQRAGPKFPRH